MGAFHEQVLKAFQAVRDVIVGDPSLGAFVQTAETLLAQAHDFTRGIEVSAIQKVPVPQIPSRESAERLIAAMGPLPPLEDDEDPALRSAYARLLANLAVGITAGIYRDFPDVVPRE